MAYKMVSFFLFSVFLFFIIFYLSDMTPYYSVCLNGELVGFFPGKKGLRQGDSLSSSLFVLVMDILSKKLD